MMEEENSNPQQEQEAPQEDTATQEQNLEEELARLKNQLMIVAADYDNYRKRVAKDIEEARSYSISRFARDLVDVVENLDRAISSIAEHDDGLNETLKQLCAGVELTKKTLLGAFSKHGIERVYPIGEAFNNDLHQAIMEVPTEDKESGLVVQVIQAGYTINGRLLMPALVAVSKAVS